MAVASSLKVATPNAQKSRLDSATSTSGIQAFKLRRQNRPRVAYLIDAKQVRARTNPRGWQKRPDFKVKRQASETLPTSVTSTAPITTTETGVPTVSLPPPPEITVTITPSIIFVTPSIIVTIPHLQLPGSPSGTDQPSLPAGSGVIVTTTPGALPGQVATTTVFPSSISSITPSSRLPSGSPTSSTSTLGASANSRTRLVPIVVGSVIGGLIPLLFLLCLFLRWRKHQRRTRPVLLADPFPEVRVTAGQLVTIPQPSAFGAAMVASTSDTSSPKPAKFANLHPDNPQESHARQDSISTTNSPGSNISPQDTMLEIQALRQRILEVENMALRQRVADVENAAQRQDTGESSTGPRVDRASESPPEYVSPVDESRPPIGQN